MREVVEYVGLVGDGLQHAAAHFAAGAHEAGNGGGFVVRSLDQLFQIQDVVYPQGVDAVDVLIEQVNGGAGVQRGLQAFADARAALELQVNLVAGFGDIGINSLLDDDALGLGAFPHGPVHDGFAFGGGDGCQGQHHHQGQQHGDSLLHKYPPYFSDRCPYWFKWWHIPLPVSIKNYGKVWKYAETVSNKYEFEGISPLSKK